MSWRQSFGREICNRCRQTIALGTPVYAGELTPAVWCEPCAGECFSKTLGDAQDVPKHRPVPVGLTGLRELVAKFAPKVQQNWGERE